MVIRGNRPRQARATTGNVRHMSDISELENRLSAAMARIADGVEALSTAAVAPESDEPDILRRALEDEKTAAAQMEERIKALHDRQETLEADLNAATLRAQAAEAHAGRMADAAEAALEAEATAAAEPVQAAPAEAGIDFEEGRDVLGQLARRLRRLRGIVNDLKASNQQMRHAIKKDLPDASLVNQALEAEFAEMQAMRAVEEAEAEAIMAVMRPMLQEVSPEAPDEDTNQSMGDA